ncbi:MAG: thiolase family protein [Candidatus Micrarchaeia archaeon]
MKKVYIASAVRTPIGKFGGSLKTLSAVNLGSIAIKSAIEKAGITPEDVDFSIMGNVLRAGHGQNIARQCAIAAGIPAEKDSYSIDMVCSSGMMSIINASNMIVNGDADIVIAGGTESMSQSKFVIGSDIRWGIKTTMQKNLELVDTMQVDGLMDPFNSKAMGIEADMLAKAHSITREEIDKVAYMSQQRAAQSSSNGFFAKEIVPVQPSPSVPPVSIDEGIRPDTTLEKLSALKPAFSPDGMHTAGNSSQLSDGAAALVLMSEDAISKYDIKPRAELLAYSWAGVEPWRFIEGPIYAIRKLLAKSNYSIDDIDFFENNEAFALNNVLLNKDLGISYDKLNIAGGAVALGHPIGASGARIVVTLLNILEEKNARLGVASLCHGTGGSTSLLFKR